MASVTSDSNTTPRSNRLHIGIFGRRNSGKSSLLNALTGQEVAIVSAVAGTTTDVVTKPMEIHGIGPCVFIDTAGFDDEGSLGELRVNQTRKAIEKTDLAILVCTSPEVSLEKSWLEQLVAKKIPVVTVLNQSDRLADVEEVKEAIGHTLGRSPLVVSAKERSGIDELIQTLVRHVPEDYDMLTLTEGLVNDGDVVLLVMPQDIQAPKGRLILPQVQTIRDLLDKRCVVVSCTTDRLDDALASLRQAPQLIITDSQVFGKVWEKKPKESRLTSFSVLFARYKGDISAYVEGAAAIGTLTGKSRVLIAEACTHAPLAEDIGRVKIPRMLRQRYGETMQVDLVAGMDFPSDLKGYDLVIHCGGCMFNRKYVLSRIAQAREQQVPICNYGIAIAYLTGILDKITLPS